jgi:uncharacterized membrane protein YhaH (DUF805 family)
MKRLSSLAGCVLWLIGLARLAAAQPSDEEAAAAAAAACMGCGGLFLFLFIGLFVVQIALLVWVARDAKARGMDSAVLWMILVLLLPLIGIIVYILARPQGSMVRCAHCGNNRLQASVKCPHCGHD